MDDATTQAGGTAAVPRSTALGGCSAVERGTASPALAAEFTKPFRWEVVPEPNPDCATAGPAGEADTREAADAALRRALAAHASATGYLYEVPAGPASVRELARVPVRPPDPKPPAW